MTNLAINHLESQGTPFVTPLDIKNAADTCANASTVFQDAAAIFGMLQVADLTEREVKAITASLKYRMETWSDIMLGVGSDLKGVKA